MGQLKIMFSLTSIKSIGYHYTNLVGRGKEQRKKFVRKQKKERHAHDRKEERSQRDIARRIKHACHRGKERVQAYR